MTSGSAKRMASAILAVGVVATVFGGGRAAFAIGDFGPDTCLDGFVWREACGAGDHICVAPQTRAQAGRDNAQASSRVNPSGGPYGRDTCLPGFVWREACGPADHVCVPPATRADARRDNAAAQDKKKYPFCIRYVQSVYAIANSLSAMQCIGYYGSNTPDPTLLFHACVQGNSSDAMRDLATRSSDEIRCRQDHGG